METNFPAPTHGRVYVNSEECNISWYSIPMILVFFISYPYDLPMKIPIQNPTVDAMAAMQNAEVLSQLLSLWRDESPGEGRGFDVCRELAPGVGSLKNFGFFDKF